MPQHKSAIKRVRQTEVKRLRNNAKRSKMRTLVKKVYAETDKAQAEAAYKEAVAYLDKITVKGIVHKNNASRQKAALTKHVNNL